MTFIVRPDLTAQDLLIPSTNTNEYYGDEDLATFKFIGWVDEITYEDDPDGSIAKFQAPEKHFVFLYNIDLEWVAEEVVQ